MPAGSEEKRLAISAPIGYRFQRARSGKLFQKGGVLLTGYAAGFRVPLRGLF